MLKSYTISGDQYTGLTVPANGTAVASFTTTDGKIFVTKYFMSSQSDGRLLVQIILRGKAVFGAPIPVGHVAGNNGTNLIYGGLGGPLILPPNETVRVEFRDYSGSPNTVIFSFIGDERPAK